MFEAFCVRQTRDEALNLEHVGAALDQNTA